MMEIELCKEAFPETFNGTRAKVGAFRTGTFLHPEYGAFTFTRDDLGRIKRGFDRSKRALVLDYDHGTDTGTTPEERKAAGWIESLDVEGDTLVATVRLTPQAERYVRNGEYRLFSPTWTPHFKDKETGEDRGITLLRGALTNSPYIDGMMPCVALSERAATVIAGLRKDGTVKRSVRTTVYDELRQLRERLEALEASEPRTFTAQATDFSTNAKRARIRERMDAGRIANEKLPPMKQLSWCVREAEDMRRHPEDYRHGDDPIATLLSEGVATTRDEAKRLASYAAFIGSNAPISWTGLSVTIGGSEVRAVPERGRLLSDFKAGRPTHASFSYGPLPITDPARVSWVGHRSS